MSTVLFVGGASVGHIAPSVAVWQELQQIAPDARAHFVCLPNPLETEYLESGGYSWSTIRSPRLSLRFLWQFPLACRQARRLLRDVQPAVIFSKGGHISVPVCLAGKAAGIPVVLHESDTVSGRANRIVGRWAERICTGFPSEGRKTVHTGNPVRREVTRGSREQGLQLTGFSGSRPVLLVIGGSQGAQALNDAVAMHIDALLSVCDVIHITGPGKTGADSQSPHYFRREFVTHELPHLYAASTLALCRAGAGTLGELAANGIPAVVVPLRGVGHDHQQHNAETAAEKGACVLLDQRDINTKLPELIRKCAEDENMRTSLSQGMQRLFVPDAAVQIAKILAGFLA